MLGGWSRQAAKRRGSLPNVYTTVLVWGDGGGAGRWKGPFLFFATPLRTLHSQFLPTPVGPAESAGHGVPARFLQPQTGCAAFTRLGGASPLPPSRRPSRAIVVVCRAGVEAPRLCVWQLRHGGHTERWFVSVNALQAGQRRQCQPLHPANRKSNFYAGRGRNSLALPLLWLVS